jgi:hypothetical protein
MKRENGRITFSDALFDFQGGENGAHREAGLPWAVAFAADFDLTQIASPSRLVDANCWLHNLAWADVNGLGKGWREAPQLQTKKDGGNQHPP